MKIVSIFCTIDGESTHDGPLQHTVFVRTGGCNLRCWKSDGFCDAAHSLEINDPRFLDMNVNEVEEEIHKYIPCRRVTCSGGEPLLQADEVATLTRLLTRQGYQVTLETSGSILLPYNILNAEFASIILDVKPPSTEMAKMNKSGNMKLLSRDDYCKFVLQDRVDYDWAKEYLITWPTVAKVAFGPRYGYLEPRQIVEWLQYDKLFNIRLNMQLHKVIWPDSHPAPVDSLHQVDYQKMVSKEV